jgi:DNA polymerase-4
MKTALLRCPEAVRVSPRFDRYRDVSAQVFAIFHTWTPLVESLSLDEAFLDITATIEDPRPDGIRAAAARLKAEVRDATALTLSVGAATCKSVAKIASDLKKPDGLVVVPAGAERVFLAPLPVGRLWGVGPKGEERLARVGAHTIGELAALDRAWLEDTFGRWGGVLHDLARGIDPREVTPERETKSVSAETTFASDISDPATLQDALCDLAGQVARRLHHHQLRGRTVTVKLRDSRFETHTRQRTLPAATDERQTILDAARRLLNPEIRPGRRFRLLGVGLSGFAEGQQLELPLGLGTGTALTADPSPVVTGEGSLAGA